MTSGLQPHPLAQIFPLLEGADFDALCSDIRANGLLQPIVYYEGLILDGRNRLAACKATGTPARYVNFSGDHPLGFVLSLNLARRHLNESQRAMVAAKLVTLGVGRPKNSANLRNIGAPAAPAVSCETAAALLHVSARSVSTAKEILARAEPMLIREAEQGRIAVSAARLALAAPADVQCAIAARAEAGDARAAQVEIKKAARAARETALGARQRALPQKRYGLIYADPEWQETAWSRETGMDRAPENHYPTSSLAELCARDVGAIAAADCVLALWRKSNNPHEALRVMEAWGFQFRSEIVWRKTGAPGMGRWFRNAHEALWICARGNPPAPAPGTQWPSVVDAPVGAHSAKPEVFAEMLEAYFPSLPKIELNRRGPARAGWDAWGNEAEGDAREDAA